MLECPRCLDSLRCREREEMGTSSLHPSSSHEEKGEADGRRLELREGVGRHSIQAAGAIEGWVCAKTHLTNLEDGSGPINIGNPKCCRRVHFSTQPDQSTLLELTKGWPTRRGLTRTAFPLHKEPFHSLVKLATPRDRSEQVKVGSTLVERMALESRPRPSDFPQAPWCLPVQSVPLTSKITVGGG